MYWLLTLGAGVRGVTVVCLFVCMSVSHVIWYCRYPIPIPYYFQLLYIVLYSRQMFAYTV